MGWLFYGFCLFYGNCYIFGDNYKRSVRVLYMYFIMNMIVVVLLIVLVLLFLDAGADLYVVGDIGDKLNFRQISHILPSETILSIWHLLKL